MINDELAKGEELQTGPVLPVNETTGDMVKQNDLETEISVKERIFDRIDYLTQNQADKFSATSRSNGYYRAIIIAGTIIICDDKTYTIGLSIASAEEGDEFSQTMVIKDDKKQSIYRLDIKSGEDVTKEYKDFLNEIVNSEGSKVKDLVLRAIDSIYHKDPEGRIIFSSSNFAETELSDQEALRILSSTNLQFPPNRRNFPSLEEIFKQRNKRILKD